MNSTPIKTLTNKQTERQTLATLNSVRAFAFLGVILNHTSFPCFAYIGAWGVSVFFTLSGFLFVYNYYNQKRISPISIRNNLLFSIKKIKNLYPLHIIATAFFFIIVVVGENAIDIFRALIRLLLNIILIQEWFGHKSLCGVSWYLCVSAFCYFLFPCINAFMEKKYNKRIAWIMIVLALCVQCLIGMFGYKLVSVQWIKQFIGDDALDWVVYYFPFARFFDFFIGCNVGYLFLHKKDLVLKSKYYTIAEIISTIIVVCSIVCSTLAPINCWWNKVFIFSLSSIVYVYIYAIGKGWLSNFLSNNFILYFARISPYGFLIHSICFWFAYAIFFHIPNTNGEIMYATYGPPFQILVAFPMTIIFSEIWIRIEKKYKNKIV